MRVVFAGTSPPREERNWLRQVRQAGMEWVYVTGPESEAMDLYKECGFRVGADIRFSTITDGKTMLVLLTPFRTTGIRLLC